MIDFDEATHTYRLHGRVLPSVTTLIKPLMPDYSHADPTVGSAVHRYTELYDLALLSEENIPDEFRGYLAAWIGFRANREFTPVHIEERVYHSILGYAGTIDRIGVVADAGQPVLLDIKTGDPDPWHGVQLAGYCLAAKRLGLIDDEIERWGVYLRADGSFEVRVYDDPRDATAFNASLVIHNWKASKK